MNLTYTVRKYILCLFALCVLLTLASSQETKRCTSANCKPPDCRCSGLFIPGGYEPDEVPQMILITFDDAVNWENWEYYGTLFPPDGSRKNANGCPMSMTLFVSHNFTDYCMISKLHARGIEIADHSVTHRVPHQWWREASEAEIGEEILVQRNNIAELAEIPVEEIRGWRSPFLQPSGDAMFKTLHDNNFTYDATMSYPFPRNVYSPVIWPFTLDYAYSLGCNIKPCPAKTYPGFWLIPVVTLMDYKEHLPCAYVDFCQNKPRNKDESFEMLWKNFLRNYRTNRAPLYLNLHSLWLDVRYNFDAMNDFLERVSAMDDVYVVSMHQALEWMRVPTPLTEIKDFTSWKCPKFKPNVEDELFCSLSYRPRTAPSSTLNPDPNSTRVTQAFSLATPKVKVTRPIGQTVYPPGFIDSKTNSPNKKRRPWFLRNSGSSVCHKWVNSILVLFIIMYFGYQ